MTPKDRLIVALDVQTIDEAKHLIDQLRDVVGMFKIGSQLFTMAGPSLVEKIVNDGNKVFLDLKFHDIPHQVLGAARSAAELGVSLFTIHASGGREMMQRAMDGVKSANNSQARVIAVSVLTSMDAASLNSIGVHDSPSVAVERLVKLAQESGVDGMVSSPQEAEVIRSISGPGFLLVTPGIRPSGLSTSDDQKRVATPADALKSGADYLVVGRPITGADDPTSAAQLIVDEMANAT